MRNLVLDIVFNMGSKDDSWIQLIPLIHAFHSSGDSLVERGRDFERASWWGTQDIQRKVVSLQDMSDM